MNPAQTETRSATASENELSEFKKLFDQEITAIRPSAEDQPPIAIEEASARWQEVNGEPFIHSISTDLVGVGLSGGGIRSATFNLGILQGMQRNKLLQFVDYISTVSGGGYITGFWTRWRQLKKSQSPNSKAVEEDLFPAPKDDNRLESEAAKYRGDHGIRHLREFSRFLIPRLDLFETELWLAVGKVLGGLVYGVVFGLMIIAALLLTWAWAADFMLFQRTPTIGGPACMLSTGMFMAIVAGTLAFAEYMSATRHKVELPKSKVDSLYLGWSIGTVILIGAGWEFLQPLFNAPRSHSILPELSAGYRFNFPVFLPAGLLLAIFLLFSLVGLFYWRTSPARLAAGERLRARILFLAVFWAGLSGVWEVSAWLRTDPPALAAPKTVQIVLSSTTNTTYQASSVSTNIISSTTRSSTQSPPASLNHMTSLLGGTAAGLAALFAALSKWLMGNQEDRLKSNLASRIKGFLPNIISIATVALLSITTAMVIMDLGEHYLDRHLNLYVMVIPWMVIALFMLLIDPTKLSLHEFYRSRISRCYLGAANPDAQLAATNRQTLERMQDDMLFEADAGKPVHLVCCAANTVGEDRLSTLYRGSRSAVLSRFGLAIGGACTKVAGLKLSSALTASAAAFNSNMGRKSIVYGRTSCFLMTMLNLRLGLWVPHPQNPEGKSMLFDTRLIREFFGWTRCKLAGADAKPDDCKRLPMVHLSDGGHFENLGLYELVRRHCRYIVVCDAAADPNYSFGDLANAVRRIREDFGVEIEIDTAALRPQADGYAKEHMVAGTIHYDGLSGIDKGVLLFFKPVLTGDEPTDVLEYKRMNPDFPQQSTGDQFYSEAQWESYRRLGEHALHTYANLLLSHKNNYAKSTTAKTAQRIFREARLAAEKVPWTDESKYQYLSAKCAALETQLANSSSKTLKAQYFDELTFEITTAKTSPEEILLIMAVLQTMEEVVYGCELFSYWSHPLAVGWMNYLSRWTNLPTLRRLWPILKPMYSSSYQKFMEDRFNLDAAKSRSTLKEYKPGADQSWQSGYAARQWLAGKSWVSQPDTFVFGLELLLEGETAPIQIGIASVGVRDRIATWSREDLFIANTLRGGGFTSKLLDGLLSNLKSQCDCAIVTIAKNQDSELQKGATESGQLPGDQSSKGVPIKPRDQGRRREIVELVDFYRSRGFEWQSSTAMVLRLEAKT